ncbi:MAG TPA: peptidoglycan recognition family protein [Gemmatimonadaceae bacterium]|nr:peptidoglycan recognition family protein [Gemmatimonadaceae bacterium]
MRPHLLLVAAAAASVAACSSVRTTPATTSEQPPAVIAHAQWQASPPLGYAADAIRRNKPVGGTLEFHDLSLTVLDVSSDSAAHDVVRLRLHAGTATEDRTAREGEAFNWNGYHVAVVAIYGKGELGGGLVALEAGTLSSLPGVVASSEVAGGAALRLRVPQRITSITLHHEGSPKPLLPTDDPVAGLRALQAWGERDRNWWDVPYHYLIDLDGHVYEGRDWHYMGETNTTYDPSGHLLISILGNYNLQEPTQAQLNAIADVMAWAVKKFDVPLDSIRGHYNYADTNCPGKNLRKYLEDGTFRRMVVARLDETD